MPISGLLPEIAEDEATAEVQALYAALRSALGVGTINLVYRHLATLDGALAMAVRMAEQLRRSGLINLPNRALDQLDPRLPVPHGALDGVDPSALHQVERVLVTYTMANPRNYLVVGSLVSPPDSIEASGPFDEPSDAPDLPPVPRLESLNQRSVERGLALAAGLGLDPSLLPTLHRHVGAYPQVHRVLMNALDAVGGASFLGQHADAFGAAVVAQIGTQQVSGSSRDDVAAVWRMFEPAIASHSVLSHLWLGAVRTVCR